MSHLGLCGPTAAMSEVRASDAARFWNELRKRGAATMPRDNSAGKISDSQRWTMTRQPLGA